MKNIVLTGFMGAGKSTVGRMLAKDLGYGFFDMDEFIEKDAKTSVADIFKTRGEAHFRGIEADVVKRLCAGEFGAGLVVSAGGGAVVDVSNRKALKAFGAVICLSAGIDEILKRLKNSGDSRPLLNAPDREKRIAELLEKRRLAYADSDLCIDTTGKDARAVAGEIKDFIRKQID